MNLDRFLGERRPSWQQLEELLTQTKTNIRRLSPRDLETLGRLYRSTTSDLALAQRDFPNQRVSYYLNGLVSRAHAQIYQEAPLRQRALSHFYRYQFPLLYRALLPYTSLCFAVFLIGAMIAYFVTWRQPDAIYIFAGPGIESLVRQVEEGKLWTEIAPSARAAASSFILTNNIRVMFLTFAGGITAGLLTLWVMVSNGLHFGALFGLLQGHGLSGGLAEFVVAHGFIELSVIFLAGGCGLYIGDGLIRPGLRTRRTAVVQHSRKGVQLILGCVPLLILAGLIEGFISPSGLPWPAKLAIGWLTGILLHAYWLYAGKPR